MTTGTVIGVTMWCVLSVWSVAFRFRSSVLVIARMVLRESVESGFLEIWYCVEGVSK